jgi:hypothetical protein
VITLEDYFGPWIDHPDATIERQANARTLLGPVNDLLNEAAEDGVICPVNAATGSQISGQTLGGFRPQNAAQGSPASSHKQGRGVDIYDPGNKLDSWLDDEKLEAFGLYREAPQSTPKWCHLTDRAPGSGRRTFQP